MNDTELKFVKSQRVEVLTLPLAGRHGTITRAYLLYADYAVLLDGNTVSSDFMEHELKAIEAKF